MKTTAHTTHLLRRLRWDELAPAHLAQLVATARDEDLAGRGLATPPARTGDPTTAITLEAEARKFARANLVARCDCTACGLRTLQPILDAYADTTNGTATAQTAADGTRFRRGDIMGTVEGSAALLLSAERVMLNFLQRLTGIATLTDAYAVRLEGTDTRLLDTRKTTPGWRMLEKYAVATGGGWNHRLGLFDRIMLKDDHLAAGGAAAGERLAALVRRAREARPDLPVECEVDAISQIAPVLDAGADVILLDNFVSPRLADELTNPGHSESLEPICRYYLSKLSAALAQIGDRAWTEVSGGVTLDTISEIARLRPDFISTGAVTHHAAWTDIGLDWE